MTFLELKKILLRIYSRIKGVKDDRYYLLKNFPKNGSGIEIGVWKGDFTRRLLRQSIPSKVFLVDPYTYYPEFERAWFGNSKFNQSGMDAVYMKVKSRFRRQIDKGKITFVRKESVEAAEQFEDGQFDWIYVDGNHMYEYVLKDLETYFPKLKVGGIIAGDDYNTEGWWKDGVTKAVKEFASKYNKEIAEMKIIESQFLIRKK